MQTRKPTGGTPPGMADLQCACASARKVARVLTQLYDQGLRDSGIEAPQFALLAALQNGACSQAELGHQFAMDKTTVSRNLKLLERAGWIQAMAAEDKRKRHFNLTPAGQQVLAAATIAWTKTQERLMAAMNAGRWNALFRTFGSVIEAAQALSASPQPIARR